MQAYQQFGAQNPAYSMQAASNFYNQASQATAYNVLSQSYGVTGMLCSSLTILLDIFKKQ